MRIDSDIFEDNSNRPSSYSTIPDGRYVLEVVEEKICSNGSLCLVLEVVDGDETGFRFCSFYDLSDPRGKMAFRLLCSSTALDRIEDSSELVGQRFDAEVIVNKYTSRTGEEKESNRIKKYILPSLMSKRETKQAADNLAGHSYNDLPF